MLIKFLLKIWPALLPITLYALWVLVIEKLILKFHARRKKIIEGEFKVVGEKSSVGAEKNNFNDDSLKKKSDRFSLSNPWFVITLYAALIIAIVSLIFTAFH